MRITKSIQLANYLFKRDIAFLSDNGFLIIDDLDYKRIMENLPYEKNGKVIHKLMATAETANTDLPKPVKKVYYKSRKQEGFRRPIPDEPKKFVRPAAVYSNPNYKNMYLND
jgi:5,10-methenyltetrahydromethanopterin hydrogenase